MWSGVETDGAGSVTGDGDDFDGFTTKLDFWGKRQSRWLAECSDS